MSDKDARSGWPRTRLTRSGGGRRALQIGLCALLFCVNISAASSQQLNQQQLELIRATAKDICTTIREAKGRKSNSEIASDVKAQLTGLAGRLDAGASERRQLSSEEYDGLSQEATAAALQDDRRCRERLFVLMFGGGSVARPAAGPEKKPSNPQTPAGQPSQVLPTRPVAQVRTDTQRPKSRQCQRIPHYFCGADGCLHRTLNGMSMGLPKKSCL
jgi:hypothetical protein